MSKTPPLDSRVDRYADESFPPYRFVPGAFPHPTADPAGHSYHVPDELPPEVLYVTPERWCDSPDYLYGADLYNHGYWWEAHEAWEGLWQLTDKQDVQGKFLQGLIQTAALHLKFFQRQRRGFDRLRGSSRAYLDFVLGRIDGGMFMGLDVARFVGSVDAYYAEIEWGGDHDAAAYPYVRLASGRM